MTTIGAPVPETERHVALDVLRGVAVLGILVMNIQSFAMPFAAYFNPTALGPPSDVDFTVWTIVHVFADQKFMSMFSILFGAGVLLFATRAAGRTGRSAALHYRRMFWLLVFGLMHAYLIWYGDILVLYAICGMLIYPLRRFGARTLIVLGLLVVSVAAVFMFAAGTSIDKWPPEAVAEMREFWSPDAAKLAEEFEAFRGGWLAQMPLRAAYSFDFHTFEMWIWGIWRAGGLMLLGMGLFKLGVLTGDRPRSFYLRLAVIGFVVGPLLTAWGVMRNIAEGWRVEYSFFIGGQWNYWGSVFTRVRLDRPGARACGSLARCARRSHVWRRWGAWRSRATSSRR